VVRVFFWRPGCAGCAMPAGLVPVAPPVPAGDESTCPAFAHVFT